MSNKKYVIKIITDLDKLSNRADEVLGDSSEEQVRQIINDVKDTLRAHQAACALCAPQIGVNKRIFCLKFANGDIRAFLNPLIVSSKGLCLSRESCASIKDKEFIIPRHSEVTVAYQTPIGVSETNIFKGVVAALVEQMCQLLDGLTLEDFGLEVIEGFDEATKEEQDEICKLYLDHLKSTSEELKKEIEETPDLKTVDNAINFMSSVALGDTKVERMSDKEIRNMMKHRVEKLKEEKEKKK